MKDPPGVVEFCARIRPRLVGMLSLLCGNGAVAEDLAQETLARVWLHWEKVRDLGADNADAWTYRVAVNLANSWLRRVMAERRARARLLAGAARVHDDPDPSQMVELRRAVAALPRRQRTALVLRYHADLPIQQVAMLMGCSPGTVKSLTNRAVTRLRARLVEVSDGG